MLSQDKRNSDEIQTYVIKIKTVHFDYKPFLKQNESYNCKLHFQEFFEVKENSFSILTTAVILSSSETDLDRGNAAIKVMNDFRIEDIGRFIVNNQIDLPEYLDKVLISISYSHTRALFTELLLGTPLAEVLLPIVSADKLYEAKKNQ